jgi:TolA-binding protein
MKSLPDNSNQKSEITTLSFSSHNKADLVEATPNNQSSSSAELRDANNRIRDLETQIEKIKAQLSTLQILVQVTQHKPRNRPIKERKTTRSE